MKKQILDIGHNLDHCAKHAYNLVYEVGKEVTLQSAILITGLLRGIIEATSKEPPFRIFPEFLGELHDT